KCMFHDFFIKGVDNLLEQDHVFKPHSADKLLSKERQEQLPASSIIEMMGIDKNDTVADFGAGNGYFTLPIAAFVDAKVYAIDAEAKILELLEERATEQALTNITYLHATIEDTPIETASLDKVLTSRTIHHAMNMDNTLAEMKRVLKPTGELFIIEFYKDEKIDGPPMEMRIDPNEMVELLEEAGFTAEVIDINERSEERRVG